MDTPLLTVMRASARRVLDEYDHEFSIEEDQRFIILYGPNGVGKTKFLEIIHALSSLNAHRLSSLPFETAQLDYSDGSQLSVSRDLRSQDAEGSGSAFLRAAFTLSRPDSKQIQWNYENDGFEVWVQEKTPYEELSIGLWQDPLDGEIVSTDELRARFVSLERRREREPNSPPKEMVTFVAAVPSFLIETQRLRTDMAAVRSSRRPFSHSKSRRVPRSQITKQAEQIRELINDAQTEHSRITQQLDRTFPNRVLSSNTDVVRPDADQIRERYDAQNDLRSRLGRIASVALDDELSLPDGELDDWALKLLKLYLDDADQKLAPFETLLSKVELLEQIVNEHLLNKQLRVTDGEGLSVVKSKSEQSIALDSLSSGEQHEIILMIDLLFNVQAGALVLIDEPEISLHVAWQLAFIPDVQRVAELANFRFIVATHSPQIINDAWSHAYRLGPPEVDFE